MSPAELLKDAFERIVADGVAAVDGLGVDELTHRVGPEANTVAWLIWHLTRIQDDHVSEVAGLEQVWTAQGFVDRFGLPFHPSATGFGQSTDEVEQVRADAELLAAYLTATHGQTLDFLDTVSEEDLDRVIDTSWDPPVTLGVRLVSVVNDGTEHVGQAAFVRGIILT